MQSSIITQIPQQNTGKLKFFFLILMILLKLIIQCNVKTLTFNAESQKIIT